MPIRPEDYSAFVNRAILASLPEEIDCRNVISKSYYGMYHGVLGILVYRPTPLRGVGCHESLKEYLVSYEAKKNEPYDNSDLRRLKVFLEMYKKQRNDADYNLNATFTHSAASSAAIALDKFLVICSKMQNQSTPRAQP